MPHGSSDIPQCVARFVHWLSRKASGVYTGGVRESPCEEIRRSIGFSESDAVNVRSLSPYAKPAIPAVIDRFYRELLRNDGARALFTGGEEQIQRLRATLSQWLAELFDDPCDETYYAKRRRIGTAHVRVGLPQHYMFAGMELIWQELERQVHLADPPHAREKMLSLHKLLMFDLAVMLESYKESYSEQIREVERTSIEERLTRAEHLAMIGQLAASLAHEIKNPLAGISGAIQIIRDDYPDDDPHQPILTEVLGQIGRLDATVKDLLQYARPTPPQAAKVAIDSLVNRVLTVLHEEPALQSIRMKYEKAPADTVIYADDRQIEQLLINLLINAAHASDEGGVVLLSIVPHAGDIRLIVKDQGKGMAPEVRDKAFEAFFTTKARGTGLGLPICRRIAEVHGGDITIDSEPGRGTTVTVTLPCNRPANSE